MLSLAGVFFCWFRCGVLSAGFRRFPARRFQPRGLLLRDWSCYQPFGLRSSSERLALVCKLPLPSPGQDRAPWHSSQAPHQSTSGTRLFSRRIPSPQARRSPRGSRTLSGLAAIFTPWRQLHGGLWHGPPLSLRLDSASWPPTVLARTPIFYDLFQAGESFQATILFVSAYRACARLTDLRPRGLLSRIGPCLEISDSRLPGSSGLQPTPASYAWQHANRTPV